MLNTLQELCNLNGISGHEHSVREWLINNIECDELLFDNLGSVAFKIQGSNPNLSAQAVVAHLDEVGMVVSDILDNGMIKFRCVGGINLHGLTNQRVVINQYPGVILGTSPHLGDQELKAEDLVIDLGCSNHHQTSQLCSIGDMISFANQFTILNETRICAKSLDNRIGIYLIYQLSKYFNDHRPQRTLYLCASVQEEVGLRGSKTLMNILPQELAQVIVVDVSPVDDYDLDAKVKLGEGALLRIQDPYMLFDYQLINHARDVFDELGIKYQNYFSKGGTDSASIQIANHGNRVLAICVGGRNLHTNHSICDLKDIHDAETFLQTYLTKEVYEKED